MKDAIKLILKTILKFIIFAILLFIIVGIGYMVAEAIMCAWAEYLENYTTDIFIFLYPATILTVILLLSGYVAYKFRFVIFKKGAILQNILSVIFILLSLIWIWAMIWFWFAIFYGIFV